jgi:hypothetical protein
MQQRDQHVILANTKDTFVHQSIRDVTATYVYSGMFISRQFFMACHLHIARLTVVCEGSVGAQMVGDDLSPAMKPPKLEKQNTDKQPWRGILLLR